MLIRDLVTLNAGAEMVNDVQLGWYPDDPRNGSLAEHYIFTDKAPEGKKSSIALLEQVRDAFTYSRENRFVVMATYGHGKTHFALALANFFGKPAQSDEVRGMLVNIGHASSAAKAQGLRDFKGARSPYLVVRLRGDKAGSLSQQFLTGLETALGEQEATRGARLPLWFSEAERFLGRLTPEQRERADRFLKVYELDTELLLRQVQARAADTYEVCRALSRELYEMALDFRAEVSLEDVVKLAVDDYCGEGKPFTGLLVLFDEFSEFIRRYAERRGVGGASLQDLLDGIHSRQERSAFVAFAQHDPDTVAQNIFRVMADTEGQASLSKELTRLPMPQRQTLFSSLETVLAAYLKQEKGAWEALYDQAFRTFDDATDSTMDLCDARYAASLGWDTERVSEVLTRGGFPLHPLTTALLCSVSLREVTNPRAVLGFVQEALGRRLDQPALVGNSPNWVYAIDLVDYFRDMLAEKEWEQYQGAAAMLGGDITESQARVLKAMLLVSVAQLKTRALGYARVVSLLSGMSRDDCHATLTELSENGHIQHDPSSKAYTFWMAGSGGNRLDKEIKKCLAPSLNIDALNKEWAGNGINRLVPIEVGGIGWGSAKDYEASEYLLTRTTFTADRVRRLATTFQTDSTQGMTEGVRGSLIWLIAESESDVAWFQDNAKAVLDEALPGSHPPPVVLVLSSVPRPQFTSHVLRAQALAGLPSEILREYGEEVRRTTADRYKQAVDEELRQIRAATQFEVPAPYRVSLAQRGPVRTAARALEVSYQEAYRLAPASFFTQYGLGTQNLRKAVCHLSFYIADNRVGASGDTQANAVQRELMSKYLRVGPPSSWGLVTVGDDLQPPTAQRTRVAWDLLEAAFKPGQPPRPVRDVLVPLFNAPFGYDYHHVLLLFSAWYGFHQQYLVMQDGARRTTLSAMLRHQDKPKDIVLALCRAGVCLSRKDKDEAEQELMALIQRMSEEVYTKTEAQNALAELRALVSDEEKLAENLQKSVQSARGRVERGAERVNEYIKAAEALQFKMEREESVVPLIQHYEKIGGLPKLGCVTVPENLSAASLQKQILSRLNDVLERQCRKYKQLNAIEDYGLHKRELNTISQSLNALGQPSLLERVRSAQEALDLRRDELKRGSDLKQQDTAIVAELRALPDQGPLAQLRQAVERLKGFEPRAPETAALIQRKVAALERGIAAQEQFVAGLSGRLDGLTEAAQVRKIAEEIQRRYDSYVGTPEFTDIEKASTRCEGLEKTLSRLASYRSALASARAPRELEDLRTKANRARELAIPVLSERQAALFTALEADLDGRMARGRHAAQEWLDECRREAQQPSPQALNPLLTKLGRPHPFLPEQDAPAVETLRAAVQQKLDENEVEAITQRFQRILDPQKRRACLEALQQLAHLEGVA